MRCANSLTSGDCAFDFANLPASMSTWLAVTTMAAICASVGPLPCAAAPKARARSVKHRVAVNLMSVPAAARHHAPTYRLRELERLFHVRCRDSGFCFELYSSDRAV